MVFQKGHKGFPKKEHVAITPEDLVGDKLLEQDEQKERVDETALLLKQAGELFQKAASTRGEKQEILKQLEGVLSQIRLVDVPELEDSPIVKKFLKAMGVDDLRPGEIANKGTLAEREREWSWNDLRDMVRVRFTPNETIPITFNGLTVQLQEDQEIEVPACFYDIYREHREALRQARINESYLMGRSDTPPSPLFQTAEGARVRAFSTLGRPYGVRGGLLGTGPIAEEEGASSGEES